MADFNSKYTGEQVESILDQVASGNAGGGSGGITVETDPIFSKSPAASITTDKMASWDNKVDSVSGKALSTEDFTTALKTKLEGLSNYDDTELSEALSALRGDFDKLVSGDTTTAIKTFNEVIAFLDGIQDIQDLSSIIASIEQQIAGKMDKVTLATVATTGNYNDLSNKPTIPSAVTESTVSGWGFTKNTGTYSKPSGGIPKNDLASAVQNSLGKADTALQSYTEQYKGTVTGVKINGTTKNPTSGVVDLGTVITSHQDISGKQDKLVSGTNIKTINGTSILGSGNIEISGGSGTNKFYTADFTISDLQQLVNGDLTEVSANCSALSQALQNNQIIVIPYGLTADGYFGYSLPDVYYEDLLYMTITDSGSGIVYAVEVPTDSNYIHSNDVSIVNSNNEVIVQGGSAIDLKIDFYQLYLLYSANQESDTIELNDEGCVDTLFRELTWEEVESLIRAGTYSFFTTNNFIDAEADRISCPVVVGYDAQGRIKSLHIYSQAAGVPMYDYNYVITFMTGDYCSITRYRTGGYTQTNMGTNTSYSTLLPNEFYVWDEVTELNIDLDLAWADSTKYTKEYVFQFTSGSEPTTLSLPDSIKWSNGEAPVIEANKIYQISILNGLGTVMSWNNAPQVELITFTISYGGGSEVDTLIAENGMTWDAYCRSHYNIDGEGSGGILEISNLNVVNSENGSTVCLESGKAISSTDLIIPNYEYIG